MKHLKLAEKKKGDILEFKWLSESLTFKITMWNVILSEWKYQAMKLINWFKLINNLLK